MDYGMFWLLSAYALVGFIWWMRGVNGYKNEWEYEEREFQSHLSIDDDVVRELDGVTFVWTADNPLDAFDEDYIMGAKKIPGTWENADKAIEDLKSVKLLGEDDILLSNKGGIKYE